MFIRCTPMCTILLYTNLYILIFVSVLVCVPQIDVHTQTHIHSCTIARCLFRSWVFYFNMSNFEIEITFRSSYQTCFHFLQFYSKKKIVDFPLRKRTLKSVTKHYLSVCSFECKRTIISICTLTWVTSLMDFNHNSCAYFCFVNAKLFSCLPLVCLKLSTCSTHQQYHSLINSGCTQYPLIKIHPSSFFSLR